MESYDGTHTPSEIRISNDDILKNSQLSYRAEGGFSGVQSYGVILSCVNGKVSVMKSIIDPRISGKENRAREIGTMDTKTYLALWDNLDRQSMFKMNDAPLPKTDILDEFTHHFYAKVGDTYHRFQVMGINRPETARYFAIRQLIDNSVEMPALWAAHDAMIHGTTGRSARNNVQE